MTAPNKTDIHSTIGVGLSFLIGNFLGVSLWTFAFALFVGLAGARMSWIRDEGVAIATTAIFILGSGFESQQPMLLERIGELTLGVVVGLAVNLLIIPPLRDQQASRYVDSINRRMGGVLVNMGEELSTSWDTDKADEWFRETNSMTEELDTAWQSVRFARESQRMNPRTRLRASSSSSGTRVTRAGADTSRVSYENILGRVDEGVSHLRNLTRTLRETSYVEGEWDSQFRRQWSDVVRDAGYAIADPDADVEPIGERLDRLSSGLAHEGLPRESWPLYGSLITSMRHIAVIVDDVASDRSAREANH
ncbi:hypothetical protein BAURA86_00579 [Brevibacterium aurantiacum]|uniref:Aromatic acid exporter family member 1 n=1 Tax=Brevibacterium aurantiacum TaxID=273384 RepID=A0A2H1IIP9_BREAU|nr:hypothetical protein BAURA86_00579 [Brevibacterium aurantiacum]